jgi:hypothetical protein
MIRRTCLGGVLLWGAVAGASGAGCSSADALDQGAGANQGVRDTEMVHESCDGEASSARRVDVNGDGRPDIIHVMDGAREACRIVDLNLDGSVDVYVFYDEQGQERRRESDFDRDGRADEITIYEGGQIVRKERETNYDSKLDTWDFFEGGHLAKRERDSDGDGIIDQWWQFNDPNNTKCAVVATDRDGDGQPDPKSVVDLCGEEYRAPGTPAPPPPAPKDKPKDDEEKKDDKKSDDAKKDGAKKDDKKSDADKPAGDPASEGDE